MDKYEYKIKSDQIIKMKKQKDFSTAEKIADTIDWHRVRNIDMLTTIGELYDEVGRLADAKEILLLAYQRAPIGRRLSFRLAQICTKSNEISEAEEFYNEFVRLAPRDSSRYILLYEINKQKGVPTHTLISILEEFRGYDFDEKWAYELASLYHESGMAAECIEECDEIILWFSQGEYVIKAMELKMLYTPLTPAQQDKYDKRFEKGEIYSIDEAFEESVITKEEIIDEKEEEYSIAIEEMAFTEEVAVTEEMAFTEEVAVTEEVTFTEEIVLTEEVAVSEKVHIKETHMEAIVEDPTKVLSEERRKMFTDFLHIPGLEEQIVDIFKEVDEIGEEKETSLTGNVMIVGERKCGKTTLAIDLMKALNKTNNRKGRKIAKISGNLLNKKGIEASISKLIGADLLIEQAGGMNKSTSKELIAAMAGNTGGMLIILEDTQEEIDKLISEIPEISIRFTHKLLLRESGIEDWVGLAKAYAKEKDYGIDDVGVLALSAKIANLYSANPCVGASEVKSVIDTAIDKSEKKNIKKLFDIVFSRKYKESDLTMLREADFN
ncbi:MAG: tetratricopeptide repeat protein [Clostridiales bacterium]|nr:tetratricopeptide repeat protein [Clostridiales bacterium]